jgi:Ni/Co efflux regulator RcnB
MAESTLLMAAAAASATGALAKGQAQKGVHTYNAGVSLNNARATTDAANYANKQEDRRLGRLMGEQRAAIAKSGLDWFEGSPLLLLEESAMESNLQQQMTSWEAGNQARAYRADASMQRKQGRNAVRASIFNAGSSLLKAGSDLYKDSL